MRLNSDNARRIVELADEMSKAFTGLTRDNGDKIRVLKDDAPKWMTDVVHAAHEHTMPDDYRYAFVEEAVDAIGQIDALYADKDAIQEAGDQIEADIYTSDLMAWLGSRVDRYAYVDDAVEEMGDHSDSIIGDIQRGQYAEKQEVFRCVVDALAELAEAEELDTTT